MSNNTSEMQRQSDKEDRKSREFIEGQIDLIDAAGRMSPTAAKAAAAADIGAYSNEPEAYLKAYLAGDMSLRAQGNKYYAQTIAQDFALNTAVMANIYVGKPLEIKDFEKFAGSVKGTDSIERPKRYCEYVGIVKAVSDTHLLQQLGNGSFVAHPITDTNSKAVSAAALALHQEGRLLGSMVNIKHTPLDAKWDVITASSINAENVRIAAVAYANDAFGDSVAAKGFVNHVTAMVQRHTAMAVARDATQSRANAPAALHSPVKIQDLGR